MALYDDCIAYWHCDEGSGVNVADDIGGKTAILTDAGWLGAGLGITPQGGGANSGNALNLIDQKYGITANMASLPSGASPRTISCWIKPSSVGGTLSQVCGYGGITGASDFSMIALLATGYYLFWAYPSNYTSSLTYDLNVWQHVVVTYDGSKLIFYKNGIADTGSGAITLATTTDSTNGMFKLGGEIRFAGWATHAGALDEVCVWTRALSPTEVATLYLETVVVYTDTINVPIAIVPSFAQKAGYKNTSNIPIVITPSSTHRNVYDNTISIPITFTPSSVNELLTILAGLTSSLPGKKTALSLYELTTSLSGDGSYTETYTGVQTMDGSLQPLSANESVRYAKETVVANYRFLVSKSVFLNAVNEAKLTEKNQLRLGDRKFDIVFVENRTEGYLQHYKALLNEVL